MPLIDMRSILRIRRAFKLMNFSNTKQSNTQKTSWIDNPLISCKFRSYLHLIRADKQVGTLLLLWPCCWSISLAAPLGSLPDPLIMTKFTIGAFLMRSAGCIINDMWDKDIDKHVERTKSRPLASGQLSLAHASVALLSTLTGSFAILVSMNPTSILLGLGAMPLVIAYPLMKHYTYFPQAVLGLAMNWGALLGWVEVTGAVDLTHTLPLYLAGVSWTMVYDTIYGYQDREDDVKLGANIYCNVHVYIHVLYTTLHSNVVFCMHVFFYIQQYHLISL